MVAALVVVEGKHPKKLPFPSIYKKRTGGGGGEVSILSKHTLWMHSTHMQIYFKKKNVIGFLQSNLQKSPQQHFPEGKRRFSASTTVS